VIEPRRPSEDVTFRPTVVLGLGGMGTFVTWRIKRLVERQLAQQVASGLVSRDVADQALNNRFTFLGIDTVQSPYLEELKGFLIGRAQGVDNLLETRYLQDSAFRTWWNGRWKPGNFTDGTGHVRLKGRLAYFLSREGGELNAATAIAASVQRSVALLEALPLKDDENVTVFVCASLSGGTGGGTFLAVLNSIKQIPRTRLHGIVIGSSIAAARSGGTRKQIELANYRAGLIELDAWMSRDPTLSDAVGWQVYWPTAAFGETVRGERPPADVVWLFDMANDVGRTMPNQLVAINSAADAVATWIHSSTTRTINALDSDIQTTVADMTGDADRVVGRPVRYGAMGVAHLEFSADRALEYLSATFGLEVINGHVLALPAGATGQIRTKVQTCCGTWQILEAGPGQDQILDKLRGLRKSLPPRPALEIQLNRARNRNEYATLVAAAVTNLEAEPAGRLTTYRAACAAWIAERLAGRPATSIAPATVGLHEELRGEVAAIIADAASGFAIAEEFLKTLRSRILDDEALSLTIELDGESGYEAQKRELARSRTQAVSAIPAGFLGNQDRRVHTFVTGWWESWLAVNEAIIERRAALEFYEQLVPEVDAQLRALEVCRLAIETTAAGLRRTEAAALQPPAPEDRGGVAVSVLSNDPELLRSTFPKSTGDSSRVAKNLCADPRDGVSALFAESLALTRRLAQRDLSEDDRQRAQLERKMAQKALDALVGDPRLGQRLGALSRTEFEDVTQFSVWDALDVEARSKLLAPRWEDYLGYVARSLEALAASSAPMFPVEALKNRAVGLRQPAESTFLVTNLSNAHAFAAAHGGPDPDGWLDQWIHEHVGLNSQAADTVDRHRISVVQRIVGFPLLAAADGWGDEDLAALEDLQRSQFIWSDARAKTLPRDFGAINKADIAYLVPLAISSEILVHLADGGFEFPAGRPFASGFANVVAELVLNPGQLRAVAKEVGAALASWSRDEWTSRLTKLEGWLADQQKVLAKGSPDARAVESMGSAVKEQFNKLLEIDAGGHQVAVEDLFPIIVRRVGDSLAGSEM